MAQVERPPGPPPLEPGVAVSRHVQHVSGHVSLAVATDETGQRALTEARASLSGAEAALRANALRTADELAASADDLAHAVTEPKPHGRPPDAADVLPRVTAMVSFLAAVPNDRVRSLLAFANDVADHARHEAAAGDPDAGREAVRAEAIARAATHVAIAADPSVAPAPDYPKPPKPPRRGVN